MNFGRTLKFISAVSLFSMIKIKYKKPANNILRVFKEKYPNATFVCWMQTDALDWNVHFNWKQKEYSALFNNKGRWLESTTLVLFDFLPSKIKIHFIKNYNIQSIRKIYEIHTPSSKLYKIEWCYEVSYLQFFYDTKGNLIQKIEIECSSLIN